MPSFNVIWHIISDPRDIDFFAYVKKPKYANCKMLKNAGPKLNLESDKMGQPSSFHGRIRF